MLATPGGVVVLAGTRLSRKHILASDRRLAGAGRHRLRRPLIRSTAGTAARRSRRRWRRPTTSSRPERLATSGRAACTPGSSRRPSTCGDAVRLDAEPLQLIYREEERAMIPQCLDQGVGLLPWHPLARGLLAGNRTRDGEQHTVRARTDPFGESLYRPELDFAVIDRARTPRQNVSIDCGSPGRGFREAWPLVGAGCACLGPPQAGSDGADRRSDEARASRGRARRRRACTGREGDQAPRGAVPASLGARQRCSRSRQLR